MRATRIAVESVSGIGISLTLSLLTLSFTVFTLGLMGIFLFPVPILIANLVLGYVFAKIGLKALGLTIAVTGSILATYFALRILFNIPAYFLF